MAALTDERKFQPRNNKTPYKNMYMQNTYQYNDHFLSDYLIVESLENAINPPKKKKETVSIPPPKDMGSDYRGGLKEDFWGAGTVSLLDLSTGDERCIHFV